MRAMSNTRCWWMHRDTARTWVTSEMVCLLAGTNQGVCGMFKIFYYLRTLVKNCLFKI